MLTAYTSRAMVRLWEKTGTKIKKGNFKSPGKALGPAPARCQHLVWSAGVGSVTCRKSQAREVPGKFGRFFMRSLLCLRWSRPQVGKLLPASLICSLPVFVNTVLLEHSHTHLSVVHGCFRATRAELRIYEADCMGYGA